MAGRARPQRALAPPPLSAHDMSMTMPPPDGSRDRRIEDLSNLYLIHPIAQALVRPALALGVSANAVSVLGMAIGAGAAAADARWREPGMAWAGLALAAAWLVADGLDGKVARATGSASRLGRVLDGVCDHGVFALIYVGLAASLGTAGAWTMAVLAGVCHALQSALYEGERARFHRRIRGQPAPARHVPFYDALAGSIDRLARPFDDALARGGPAMARRYGEEAAPPMKAMVLLSANTRVLAIFVACLLGRPALFWAVEIGPLTLVAAATMLWHRQVEARLQSFSESRHVAGI
jgi:CDP-diacylglycerol---serine O-phosphatidyltransferase